MSDAGIRRYNRRHLRHDFATDVLAFEMKEKWALGDVLVSSETAGRQAREMGHPFSKELLILSVHGLLHLVGYRDKGERERREMWMKTEEMLSL